jgi:hypothetical protein
MSGRNANDPARDVGVMEHAGKHSHARSRVNGANAMGAAPMWRARGRRLTAANAMALASADAATRTSST